MPLPSSLVLIFAVERTLALRNILARKKMIHSRSVLVGVRESALASSHVSRHAVACSTKNPFLRQYLASSASSSAVPFPEPSQTYPPRTARRGSSHLRARAAFLARANCKALPEECPSRDAGRFVRGIILIKTI